MNSPAHRNLILIFIDTIAAKNLLQLKSIKSLGYSTALFEYYPGKIGIEGYHDRIKLSKNIFKQVWDVWKYVRKHRATIHHMEIYPGNVMAWFYLLLAGIFKLETVCVERGDINYYVAGGYSISIRINMWLCYRLCSIIWYKEPFMKPLLQKAGAKELFFLPNAIILPATASIPFKDRDIDFLWLNRLLPQRRSDWYMNVLKLQEFRKTKNYLVGLLHKTAFSKENEEVLDSNLANLTVEEYSSQPATYFQRAKYFVFPADRVFANHALLEAMASGVIPLVSNVEGAEIIIDNGENGFLFEHNYASFEHAMLKALQIKSMDWETISAGAKEKIAYSFSVQKFSDELIQLYSHL